MTPKDLHGLEDPWGHPMVLGTPWGYLRTLQGYPMSSMVLMTVEDPLWPRAPQEHLGP